MHEARIDARSAMQVRVAPADARSVGGSQKNGHRHDARGADGCQEKKHVEGLQAPDNIPSTIKTPEALTGAKRCTSTGRRPRDVRTQSAGQLPEKRTTAKWRRQETKCLTASLENSAHKAAQKVQQRS